MLPLAHVALPFGVVVCRAVGDGENALRCGEGLLADFNVIRHHERDGVIMQFQFVASAIGSDIVINAVVPRDRHGNADGFRAIEREIERA